jgi:Rrf2 family transcriptional regulator, iron-sulfur cluster assembly transcription factor
MLSQATGYACTALAYIALLPGPALVKDIAKATNIPAPYLAKIVQVLAKKGFVKTQRGIGGGVSLAMRAEAISLFDICDALDDPCTQTKCMMGNAQCSDERACACHEFWKVQRAQCLNFLQKTTIADLTRTKPILRFPILQSSEISRLSGMLGMDEATSARHTPA